VSQSDGDLYKGLQHIVLAYERSSTQELQRLQRMQNSLLVVVFLTLAMEAAIIFQPMVRRIMRYTGELLHLASTDSLTGLLNRRTFVERAFEKARAARRDGRPSCLLVMDADGFKRINDTHGHAIGDDVLKAMSERLSSRIRKEDVLGRIGGEEFALLLPDTRVEAARQLAERLRSAIEELEILTPDGPIRFTMSVGVSAIRFDEGDLTAALARADRALYEAKASGRNRVEVSQDLPDDEETASFKPAPA
jgi:diguanylate cyclase (GGDEF)-like protein